MNEWSLFYRTNFIIYIIWQKNVAMTWTRVSISIINLSKVRWPRGTIKVQQETSREKQWENYILKVLGNWKMFLFKMDYSDTDQIGSYWSKYQVYWLDLHHKPNPKHPPWYATNLGAPKHLPENSQGNTPFENFCNFWTHMCNIRCFGQSFFHTCFTQLAAGHSDLVLVVAIVTA